MISILTRTSRTLKVTKRKAKKRKAQKQAVHRRRRRRTGGADDDFMCPICFQNFVDKDSPPVIQLECGHLIHKTCYDDNSKHRRESKKNPHICPVCKKEFDNYSGRSFPPPNTELFIHSPPETGAISEQAKAERKRFLAQVEAVRAKHAARRELNAEYSNNLAVLIENYREQNRLQPHDLVPENVMRDLDEQALLPLGAASRAAIENNRDNITEHIAHFRSFALLNYVEDLVDSHWVFTAPQVQFIIDKIAVSNRRLLRTMCRVLQSQLSSRDRQTALQLERRKDIPALVIALGPNRLSPEDRKTALKRVDSQLVVELVRVLDPASLSSEEFTLALERVDAYSIVQLVRTFGRDLSVGQRKKALQRAIPNNIPELVEVLGPGPGGSPNVHPLYERNLKKLLNYDL